MPLGYGTPWVGQHVAPVTQLRAGRVAAEYDATDRVRCADTIIVDHRHQQLDFLSPHQQLVYIHLYSPNMVNNQTKNINIKRYSNKEEAHEDTYKGKSGDEQS